MWSLNLRKIIASCGEEDNAVLASFLFPLPHRNLGETGFVLAHNARFQSIIVEELRQQECEAAGHSPTTMATEGEECIHALYSANFLYFSADEAPNPE